jgi:hypothetical protein
MSASRLVRSGQQASAGRPSSAAMAGWSACCSPSGQGGHDVGAAVGFGGEQVNDERKAHIISAPGLVQEGLIRSDDNVRR